MAAPAMSQPTPPSERRRKETSFGDARADRARLPVGSKTASVLVSDNHRIRREIAGPALDRLTDFELEFLRRQSEFGGDGGQSNISVKARQQTGATGSRFEHIGNRRKIVTHGLSNSRTALARRWTNGDNLNHSG
jgi:hypothetical protein